MMWKTQYYVVSLIPQAMVLSTAIFVQAKNESGNRADRKVKTNEQTNKGTNRNIIVTTSEKILQVLLLFYYYGCTTKSQTTMTKILL